MLSERVYSIFKDSIAAKMDIGEAIAPAISEASELITQALLNEKKILVCGNGSSAALAQIFTSSMLDRFETERPSLPAIWLGSNLSTYTAIAADQGITEVFAKPIRALGSEGDILLVISTSGNTQNLVQALSAAHDRNMRVIALTGRDGGDVASLIDASDIEIRVTLNRRSRIHEVHLLTLFSLCDLIDAQLFGIDT